MRGNYRLIDKQPNTALNSDAQKAARRLANSLWEMFMCETDFASEYKEKILDYELWIGKAEELLEVAGFLEPEIKKMWEEMREGKFIKEHYITTYFMLSS